MTRIWNWIKGEWADPTTHVWLAGLLGIAVAYLNGKMTGTQAEVAALGAVIAIIVPTGAKT